MTPFVIVNDNFTASDNGLIDLTQEDELATIRKIMASGLSLSSAKFVLEQGRGDLDSAMGFLDESVEKLSHATNIHQRNYLFRLINICGGDVNMAESTWTSRLRRVHESMRCDDSDARMQLFAAGFEVDDAVRALKEQQTQLLVFHAEGQGRHLTHTAAQMLLERHNWCVQGATIEYDAPWHIERLVNEIHRKHKRTVDEPEVILEGVNWDHEKAVKNWEAENLCGICFRLYGSEVDCSKETGYCHADCKGHMCYACLCNFSQNETTKCPVCVRWCDFKAAVVERM